MKRLLLVLAACGSSHEAAPQVPVPVAHEAHLPRVPGAMAPSLVEVRGNASGEQLADVDSCATCHPDVAKQWSASAHSFASFGNPIYRYVVERVRGELGNTASRHCGGCHDMPLMVDGLMTSGAPIPADDLRAHSGVTCRLCHGVQSTTKDGNGSYVLDATPLDAPNLTDPESIARHKKQVTTKLDTELCVGCHRGFLSPDMAMPAHLSGIEDAGVWRASPYTGNGTARIDQVQKQTCIDCHMERVPASADEYGAKHGTVASHRFVGGHTWMASMRGDAEQLKLTQAKLEGVASIDVAGARIKGAWFLPAETAPITAGAHVELDVVIRNLLVGHRFPGGVLDMQDTWIEVEVTDRHGRRLAASGLAHEKNPADTEAHVLRTLVVDDHGNVLDEHEMAQMRAQLASQTLAPREAQAVRYALDVPTDLNSDELPLTVTARLRHRSRELRAQEEACAVAHTPGGARFLAGARGTRDVTLDPCKPQPVTLIAETHVEIGAGAHPSARPTWERLYEHGMALSQTIVTRLSEADAVLAAALAAAPDAHARAMVLVQQGWVASKLGHADVVLAKVDEARALLGKDAPVFDALLADAYVRLNRWTDARAPARRCTERAPENTAAWSVYAKVLVAVGDHTGALAASAHGLELAPRDPDLLRAQATALAALHDPQAMAAQAAADRFRAPDDWATLRITCAKHDVRCERERNAVPTIALR
jgi:tetratricopeptide (TPR) repeat protein